MNGFKQCGISRRGFISGLFAGSAAVMVGASLSPSVRAGGVSRAHQAVDQGGQSVSYTLMGGIPVVDPTGKLDSYKGTQSFVSASLPYEFNYLV